MSGEIVPVGLLPLRFWVLPAGHGAQQAFTANTQRLRLPGSSMNKMPKRRALIIVFICAAPLGLLLLLASLVIDDEPLIVDTSVPTVESALLARNLARAVLDTLDGRREDAAISASEDDLNALMTLVRRGAPRVSGRVRVRPWIVSLKVSVRLPDNPLGRYLNLQGEVLPDPRGLNIDSMQIGRLELPRPITQTLLRGILNFGLGSGEGTELLRSVQSVSLHGTAVTVRLRSVPQLKERLKRLQLSLSKVLDRAGGRDEPLDSSRVNSYYERLLETDRNHLISSSPSLAVYLGPLFRLARDRSASEDPVRENGSALVALAIHLGDPRFAKLAGVNLAPELRSRSTYRPMVQLGGRQDLCRHFVVSAGIKVLADRGVSTAIGEFKELLDAGRGGSGFSFVDLAADRAGIRFAEVATDPGGGARRLQQLLADTAREPVFFPVVAGLPENMSKTEFEQRYRGLSSRPYDELVREIDRRIGQCPAYGSHP